MVKLEVLKVLILLTVLIFKVRLSSRGTSRVVKSNSIDLSSDPPAVKDVIRLFTGKSLIGYSTDCAVSTNLKADISESISKFK